ncbi:MAG: methyltransferase domain-containing protein [archaeon]|nr:methyltransferase domain-containing protein [archaeon]
MEREKLPIKEVENLGYYDLMGYMGVPMFTIGGFKSVGQLGEFCGLNNNTKVLLVGCGTGGNAVYLAKEFGCNIVGIDISEKMIKSANIRAEQKGLLEKLKFQIGDAYALPFEPNSFDIVMTVFVSQFLDIDRSFKSFMKVLKPGGYIGINEMYKKDNISDEVMKKVDLGESTFQELTGLPFTLHTPSEYKKAMEDASLTNIKVEEHTDYLEKGAIKQIWKDMGGVGGISKSIGRMISLSFKSKKIRHTWGLVSKGKRNLMRNKTVMKHTGYILCAGQKP